MNAKRAGPRPKTPRTRAISLAQHVNIERDRLFKMRPRSEWISYADESLRIVSDELWERAQRRTQPAKEDTRLRTGGKPRYLLSGLLRCGVCDAHYTITDAVSYGCSSYHDGHACSNSIRVRRDRVERLLLGPIRDDLLVPERVERMVREMQEHYLGSVRASQARAVEAPANCRNSRRESSVCGSVYSTATRT